MNEGPNDKVIVAGNPSNPDSLLGRSFAAPGAGEPLGVDDAVPGEARTAISVIRLVTDLIRHQEIVCGYLEEAKKQGLVDVMIVGSLPEGKVYMIYSPSMNRAEQVGYLEQAKHRILALIDAGQDGGA